MQKYYGEGIKKNTMQMKAAIEEKASSQKLLL
jgi:hypothetical protein